MLLILIPENSSRIEYIFNLIFRDILNFSFRLTRDNEEFNFYRGPKFCYGSQPASGELFFASASLLFENGINPKELHFISFNNLPAFFPVGEKSALPFDPFAASFYLVSRYEEYLPNTRKDKHHRYESSQSIAVQHDFLHKPIVNIWAGIIRDKLLEHFPDIVFPERNFRFIPTMDIDNAWAYRGKGHLRLTGGVITDFISGKFDNLKARLKYILNKQNDPYDTYKYQFEIIKKYGLTPIYFFLLGDYGKYDKNVPFENEDFQKLVRSVMRYAETGIHPSYASFQDDSQLQKEIDRLSQITQKKVNLSRHHFLRINIPDSYRALLRQGITDDYTMGYPDRLGFRAGICNTYYFFDLSEEKETTLRIHPFCIMDGTLRDYMNLKPNDTFHYIDQMVEEVKNVSGNLITIWHNESFAENKRWEGWRNVYEYIIQKTTAQ